MFIVWTLPVYRPLVWLKTLIDNGVRYARDEITLLLSGIELITK